MSGDVVTAVLVVAGLVVVDVIAVVLLLSGRSPRDDP